MKLINALGILLGLCCLSMSAHAEGNCPQGYYPIGGGATAGCAPMPGSGNANGTNWQNYPSDPAPIWEDRWGAIAFDGLKGALGVATGLRSEQAAKSAALEHCKARGGVKCFTEISYVNACTAFTLGDRNYYRGSFPTLQQAVDDGLKKCSETDTNCETFYSACSPPFRIR